MTTAFVAPQHATNMTGTAPVAATGSGAATVLQVEIWLLILIPAGLRFEPLGAVGSPAIVFGLVLFLVWAVAVLTPGSAVEPCVPLRVVLSIFVSSALVSFALLHRHAVFADEASNADRFLISLVSYSGLALVAAEGLRNRDDLMRVVRTLVTAVAVMSMLAVFQFRGLFDYAAVVEKLPIFSTYRPLAAVLGREGLNRPAGTATHPIEFGVVVGLVLALAIHLAVHDRVWPPWRRRCTLAIIAFGIPLSVSRSALLLGLIVVISFVVTTSPVIRRQTAQLLAAFTVVVFVLVPGLLGTLRSSVTVGQADPSISTRTSDYAAVSPYLRAQPWFGRGPGTFLPRARILDNQYLLTLIEMGIVGLVSLVCLFAVTNFMGGSARRLARTEADRNLSQMFAAAGLGVLAAGVTFDALSFPMFTMITALLTGLAGTWLRVVSAESRTNGA